MKLFLTSAGLPKETRNDFLGLLGKNPEKARAAFIPTAADPEEDKRFVESARKEIRKTGLGIIEVDLKRENAGSLREKLFGLEVVYVNGGNAFYLLDWVRKSGFDGAIREFLKMGGIYVGVSAGTILTGPRIDLAGWKEDWDKNIPGLNDTTGLSLVDFAIAPHYLEGDFAILSGRAKDIDYAVVALTDKQAILVDGKKIRAVGPGKPIQLNGVSSRASSIFLY